MDIKTILLQFLIDANISVYEGTIKSLIEMIYWVTSEQIPINCLVSFIIRNHYLDKYRLTLVKANGQMLVKINVYKNSRSSFF